MCSQVPAVLPISAETKQFPQATTHTAGVGVKPLRYMNIKLSLTKSVASLIVCTNIWNYHSDMFIYSNQSSYLSTESLTESRSFTSNRADKEAHVSIKATEHKQ